MNIKILKKTEDEVHVEFEGESHTLLNLLRTELLKDDRVLLATHNAKFPTMTEPVFRLKTKDADPVEVMREAASRVVDLCDEFKVQYEAAVK